jgi:ADP-dependent NAD(P)H-hydrate dehydratase
MTTRPADLPLLPRRRRDASKRDHGRIVVVGGAVGMAGAPALSAMAALRAGAGLVELLVPEPVAAIAAGFDPCVMTRGGAATDAGTFATSAHARLAPHVARGTALAIGPGIGRSADVEAIVARLWREAPQPAVFDADALWALARRRPGLAEHAGPRIITPHAGEMLRLAGRDAGASLPRDWLEHAAAALAREAGITVVLKGAGTFIVDPIRTARNETGNPGMATAGTGDVLTGVVAALAGQGLEPFAAARLGVWVHGRAGDAAASALGETSLTARDLLDRLHVAFSELEAADSGSES